MVDNPIPPKLIEHFRQQGTPFSRRLQLEYLYWQIERLNQENHDTSIAHFAQSLSVPPQDLRQWLAGTTTPNARYLERMEHLLKTSLKHLLKE